MARIYLDEQSRVELKDLLAGYGHDVLHTYDVGRRGALDSRQLLFAAETGRILVTLNREDFEELHLWCLALNEWGVMHREHAGIFTTWGDINAAEWAELINSLLQSTSELTNQLYRYNRRSHRWRPYPTLWRP